MKPVKKYLTVFFTSMAFWCVGQVASDSTIAKHVLTKKSDIAIFPANSRELFDGGERFTPSRAEVDKAEHALTVQLAKLNADRQNQYVTPVIDKNLSKYRRQYFGYMDKKGNKILFINCFWKRDKEGELLWLKERIRVLDGGSYYWNVKYDVGEDGLFDLEVNGDV